MTGLVSFDLVFRPSVDLISIVRQFVSSFYSQILGNGDDGAVSNLGLVTHELLENAIKYGTGGETRLCVEFDRVVNRVAIRMWNSASEAHIAVLKRNVKELSEAPDAFAHYQAVMRRSAKRANGSGLGLARITGEAEMSLSVTADDGRVCITAQTRPGAIR